MDNPIKSSVQVPTLAGDRSDETTILLVKPEKAAEISSMALEIALRRKEQEETGMTGIRFYVRHREQG